jgi:hypothetical protein
MLPLSSCLFLSFLVLSMKLDLSLLLLSLPLRERHAAGAHLGINSSLRSLSLYLMNASFCSKISLSLPRKYVSKPKEGQSTERKKRAAKKSRHRFKKEMTRVFKDFTVAAADLIKLNPDLCKMLFSDAVDAIVDAPAQEPAEELSESEKVALITVNLNFHLMFL